MGENVYEFKDWTHPGGFGKHSGYVGGSKDAKNLFEGRHGKLDGTSKYAKIMESKLIG